MDQGKVPSLPMVAVRNWSDPSFRPYVSLGALLLPQFVPGVTELRPLEQGLLEHRYAVYFAHPSPINLAERTRRLVDASTLQLGLPRLRSFAHLIPIPAPDLERSGRDAYLRTLQSNLDTGIDVLLAPGWSVDIEGFTFRVLQEPDGSPLLVLVTPVAVGD